MALNTIICSLMVGVSLENIYITTTEVLSAATNVPNLAVLHRLFCLNGPSSTGKSFPY